jgi:hypothetical protein
MRRLIIAILVGAVAVPDCVALAQPAQRSPDNKPPAIDLRPMDIGLGAIAGVVAFNVAALGLEALPGGYAYAAGATVPAEMSVAMSRVYATTGAVIGGWIAYYTYGR